jgi:hypothetical protein
MRIVEQLSVSDQFCAVALSGGHVTRPRSDTKKAAALPQPRTLFAICQEKLSRRANAAVACFVPSEADSCVG